MLIIGIAGGTGSGKTTVVHQIMNELPETEVGIISQDSYYKETHNLSYEERTKINFDHPRAIDFELLSSLETHESRQFRYLTEEVSDGSDDKSGGPIYEGLADHLQLSVNLLSRIPALFANIRGCSVEQEVEDAVVGVRLVGLLRKQVEGHRLEPGEVQALL